MDVLLILTGMGVGLAFSAPIGPVNLLCIRKTMAAGFRAGLFTGIGAAIGDAIYAAIGAFGVTAVMSFVQGYSRTVQVVGGALVIAFGISTFFRTQPAALAREKKMERYKGLFAGFALTMANPGVLAGFIAVFGGFGEALITPGDFREAATLVVGVILGAMLWWVGLSFLVSQVKQRLDGAWFDTLNHAAGIVLIVFGAGLLARVGLGAL